MVLNRSAQDSRASGRECRDVIVKSNTIYRSVAVPQFFTHKIGRNPSALYCVMLTANTALYFPIIVAVSALTVVPISVVVMLSCSSVLNIPFRYFLPFLNFSNNSQNMIEQHMHPPPLIHTLSLGPHHSAARHERFRRTYREGSIYRTARSHHDDIRYVHSVWIIGECAITSLPYFPNGYARLIQSPVPNPLTAEFTDYLRQDNMRL
ncbi:hypothetical protein J6590_038401 [Homalodisca vitripennis]|nr:hypothetical protein J6590_038401 [Homalodisca vitripennis]